MNENASINEQLDWKKAEVIVAGVDIGSVSSKALILLDGQPYAFSQVKTLTPKEAAQSAVNEVLAKTNLTLEKIHSIVATGCGRKQVQHWRPKLQGHSLYGKWQGN
jgi:benzoyl-CoA reductase subunit A